MAPVIQKFLFEGSSLISYGGRDVDSLIGYLDKNMLLLKGRIKCDVRRVWLGCRGSLLMEVA